MSHTGITPLKPFQVKLASGMLLPSGEANFFDFRQHTSSDWDSTNPSGDVVFSSPSGFSSRNPNYIITRPVPRHKEFFLNQGEDETENARKYIVGSGINFPFPHPYNVSYPTNVTGQMFSIAWWEASGIYQTYSPDTFLLIDRTRESGILHWEGFRQVEDLSNSPNIAPHVPDVNFQKYIHHLPEYPNHRHKPNDSIEPPDYSDPSLGLVDIRDNQKRKYIEAEYLSDVKKRNLATGGLSYVYSEDGLFTGKQTNVGYSGGMCVYPDGTCKNGISQQACIAYPGAIWTLGEFCED